MGDRSWGQGLGVVAVLLGAALLVPGAIWVFGRELPVVAIVGAGIFAVLVLVVLACTARRSFWAWALALLVLAAPPGLLALGGVVAGGVDGAALTRWIYVFAAGVLGGLVLELTLSRGRLELPSWTEAPAVEGPAAGATAEVSGPVGSRSAVRGVTTGGNGDETGAPPPSTGSDPGASGSTSGAATDDALPALDESAFAPFGPRPDIGLFARLVVGGLAAAVFVVLIKLADDGAAADLATDARQLDTLAWAALLGSVSPLVWRIAQRVVNARMTALQAAYAASEARQAVALAGEAGQAPGGGASTTAAPLRDAELIDLSDRLAAETDTGVIQTELRRTLARTGAAPGQGAARLAASQAAADRASAAATRALRTYYRDRQVD